MWAEDEARLGLKPVPRRVRWLKGHRPKPGGRTRGERLYVYGFARPAAGQAFTVVLPRVRAGQVADARAAFAAHADPDGTGVLVVVVDDAGRHPARRLGVPPDVRRHVLPPCTPELRPVEPFRALAREAVANEPYDRLADLRRVIRRRRRWSSEDRATVLGAIGFHWAVRLER